MRERNRYRDIVVIGAAFLLFLYAKGRFGAWQMEQKSYGFLVWSQSQLTHQVVGEFAHFLGICQFLPSSSAKVTLKLEGYSLETELEGVSLDEYPLCWDKAAEEVQCSNTAALFLGKGCFSSFADKNGHAPAKWQVEAWMAGYEELKVTVVDETGNERQGRVFGILNQPEGLACMDREQMEQIFGSVCQVRGGYLEIHGYRNMTAAKEALLGAGFSVEEMTFDGPLCGEGG